MAGKKGNKAAKIPVEGTAPLNETLVHEAKRHKGSRGRTGLSGHHHCDVCGKSAANRCRRKGHIVACEKHPETWYSAYQSCILCWEEAKREAAREEKERDAQRAARGGRAPG
ncbi:hypothetical protein MCOR27_002163 [Pyricularia oryzae]|uniref:Uncharacterized protein n=1 Tax=Pyricularia grisea TaxID=148305 RepID=A0ABQ8NKF1_PYRGI|nr:hypothetical protein MCOR01_003512 [Pyricularia oryzae]KAI6298391.1 hypothetical protein MCOR33_005464 [Pyricularia grisea]KAI6256334.1 hypothetical protein MCOR19_007218 [Pyricularia oryzae]KAI6272678.1 hypothetical protein MCOR26_007213 [Pyricularia oryzae]KAI6285643.1 hypothetical protein MCOR27_002163 [Pyricularia oryzae]